MASAVIHICVAKKVNEILKRNQKQFLIGSIAPDISKQIGETKLNSHFLKDIDNDIPELDRFLAKYQNKLKDNDFDLGYYCHLFTDMLWFALFMPEYCRYNDEEITYLNGETKSTSKETMVKLIYNDYTNLNIKMIDEYELDLSLFYEELPKIDSNIEEIPVAKLQILIDKMGIIIKNSKERGTIIFNTDGITKFINKTVEDFINNLKVLNII